MVQDVQSFLIHDILCFDDAVFEIRKVVRCSTGSPQIMLGRNGADAQRVSVPTPTTYLQYTTAPACFRLAS
jgi:hypothetical protein